MIIDFGKIKRIFKKRVQPRALGHFGSPSRKEKDWRTLIVVAMVLIVVSSLWSVYLFYRVNSGTIFRDFDRTDGGISAFDKKELRKRAIEIQTINYNFNELRALR